MKSIAKKIGVLLAGAAIGFGQAEMRPETALRAAMELETVKGDLRGAIQRYSRLAEGKDRVVAAKALLRMAQCHEKLGTAEARKIYERLVRDFAEQSDVATQARVRMGALGTSKSPGTTARLVWDQAIDYWGCISADGRLLSFIDWSTGDLAVRDLHAGEHRRVTNRGGFVKAQGEAEASCISPDGKRVAYNWQSWDPSVPKERRYEFRVINSDGSGERVIRRFGTDSWVQAGGWSPDSKWVASAVVEKGSSRIELVPAEPGEARIVPTRSTLEKRSIVFSPDGKWIAYHEVSQAESYSGGVFVVPADGSSTETLVVPDANLAGWAPGSNGILVEKTVGQDRKLFLQPVSAGKAAGDLAIVFAPAISGVPAYLGVTAKGELYYGTNNYRIEGWVMRVEGGTAPWGDPVLRFPVAPIGFANNSGNLRFSVDGRQLAAMVPNNSILIRTMADGKQRLITPALKDYRRFEWAPDGKSFLASAIGEDKRFGLYRIDALSGSAGYVCPIEQGTTFTISADGQTVYNFSARAPGALSAIDLGTCREKTLPTRDWSSQGPRTIRLSRDGKSLLLSSFAYIGIYDIASGSLREIYQRKEEVGTNVWSVDWSADGRSVVAVVRRARESGVNPREAWVFPVEGGQPRVSKVDQIRNLSMSPDGSHVAALHYDNRIQVWVMENFLPALNGKR